MGTNQYNVIITPTAYEEMNQIYDYISDELYAEKAAKKLMTKIESEIQKLKYAPKIYVEIDKIDELKRNYRRIIVNNYVILYTIIEDKKIVYIAHIYYSGRNYIDDFK